MVEIYIPDQGDIIWTDFDPQVGSEQAGVRPALVLTRSVISERSGLTVCCPITGRSKGYPFEVPLPEAHEVYGVVLVDQIKTIDWREREITYMAKAPDSLLREVLAQLSTLFG